MLVIRYTAGENVPFNELNWREEGNFRVDNTESKMNRVMVMQEFTASTYGYNYRVCIAGEQNQR